MWQPYCDYEATSCRTKVSTLRMSEKNESVSLGHPNLTNLGLPFGLCVRPEAKLVGHGGRLGGSLGVTAQT